MNNFNQQNIQQPIREHHFVEEITKYNLPVKIKILFRGNSGCGKTTTVKAIANAVGKPIIQSL